MYSWDRDIKALPRGDQRTRFFWMYEKGVKEPVMIRVLDNVVYFKGNRVDLERFKTGSLFQASLFAEITVPVSPWDLAEGADDE